MDVGAWCSQSRVWVVAGKGGVGKTTIAAALAAAAAGAGLSVLMVDLEGKHGLSAIFGHEGSIGYEPVQLRAPRASGAAEGITTPEAAAAARRSHGGASDDVGTSFGEGTAATGTGPPDGDDAVTGRARVPAGAIWARRLTPDDALLEYLADHGLQRVSKRLVSSGVLDVVATAIPGIRDVLVLGKVKQIERSGLADIVVVDAPATGHTMTFLTSASGLLDAARGGPVRQQAADVVELLRDPARCRVLPVTLPEEMPVSETIESAHLLETRVGIHLGPVVVNGYEERPRGLRSRAAKAASDAATTLDTGTIAALDAARAFRLRRLRLVQEQAGRLERELALPQLRVPRVFSPAIGPDELGELSGALARAIESMPGDEDAA